MRTLHAISPRMMATPRGVFAGALLLLSVCMLIGCSTTTTKVDRSVTGNDSFDYAADRPPTSKTLYVMARILAGQGRDGEAEFVLVRIIREDPTYAPAYCALGELQIRSHKFDDAVKTFSAGLAKAPRDAVLLNNLGMCQVTRADYVGALDYFNRAAQSDFRTPRYAANRAMAMGMLGQYDESLATYTQIVSPADAHYNLAVLCEARGDQTRATEEFANADALRAAEKQQGSNNTSPRPAPTPSTMPAPADTTSDKPAAASADATDPKTIDHAP